MNRAEQRRLRSLKNKIKYQPYIFLALKRDKNKCVDCGKKHKNLIVHHIDESRKTGKLNNDLDNLVTLCRRCHAKKHNLVVLHEEVIAMRKAGMTYRGIGERLNITRQRAYQIVERVKELDKDFNVWYNSSMSNLTKLIQFKDNPEHYEELRYIAYQKATTIGNLIREAIDIYLKEKRYAKGGEKHENT